MNIGILILSFQTLEFWFFNKHYNSDLILQNVGIFGGSCLLSDLIPPNVELWPYL